MLLRPLAKELQKKAEKELGEVPGRIQDDLDHIRTWLNKQPHLNVRTEDQWLLSFLRGCKFTLERTKERLDYFYAMRTLVPELYANRDPFSPGPQEIAKAGPFLVMPTTDTPASPCVIFFRWGVCDPDRMSYNDVMKYYFMSMDILMNENDNFVIGGKLAYIDCAKIPLGYLRQFTPTGLKQTVLSMQSAYPVRIKGLHCANAPAALETIFNLIKSFMNPKLKERLHVYSEANTNKIDKEIPMSLLPNEYGGESGSIEELTVAWKQKVESYRDWFLEEARYGTIEKLRPGTPKTSADMFGVEGTFRKLAID